MEGHLNRISDLRSHLAGQTTIFDTAGLMTDTSKKLEGVFAKRSRPAPRSDIKLQQISIDELKRVNDKFELWRTSDSSSLLLLSGYSDPFYATAKLCWLSPVAVEIAKTLRPDLLAYYSVSYDTPASMRTLDVVFSSFILQLLDANNDLCFGVYHSIKRILTGPSMEDDKTQTLLQCLIDIVGHSTEDPLYIILDRVDLVLDSTVLECLRMLLHLAEVSKNVVKILVVAKSIGWEDDEDLLRQDGTVQGIKRDENLLMMNVQWKQGTEKEPRMPHPKRQ
jgi:hypothetical protein